ncbi:conserved hypothetical protein [Theileria equi strain WA]|uniref:Telomerase reverse transcriptase n=1 Tax=Theileria equi strain WA TaxID=1537102 RepID=L1LBS7_THEEQ|nr:conserved hypothetical protein [Theileria equi strain WA]EKX72633.1 conserved hypothetical protein [Theileria equi strain WA]|eukprot:XP_004832085.1 conserved hypothetical protein [Theileria equi strain WA]
MTRRLENAKYHCGSLLRLYKSCLVECRNLECHFGMKTQPLYNYIENKVYPSDIVEKFLLAISKCIIVQEESEVEDRYADSLLGCDLMKGVDEAIKKREAELNRHWKRQSILFNGIKEKGKDVTGLYIQHPCEFFETSLGRAIVEYCGRKTIFNMLVFHRTFIPGQIERPGTLDILDYINGVENDHSQLGDVLDGVLNGMQRFKIKKRCMHIPRPDILIQCSGQLLLKMQSVPSTKEVCMQESCFQRTHVHKQKTWSEIIVFRNQILYSDSFNKKVGLPYSSIVGRINVEDKQAVWRLLSMILTSGAICDRCTLTRRTEIANFFKIVPDERPGYRTMARHGTLKYGLYREFLDFLVRAKGIKWSSIIKVCKSTQVASASSNFRTVKVSRVYTFIKLVIKATISPTLLCGYHNYSRFLEVCFSLIRLNKGENITMAQVMHKFRVKGCTWSNCGSFHSKGQTRTILNYLCRIIFFLLQYFIIPILRSHFYTTEASFSMYRLHYIRKVTWFKMVQHANKRLLNSSTDFKLSTSDHGIPLRWSPKQSGMRPIINCNIYTNNDRKSINAVMRPIHRALSLNCKLVRVLGNGVLGFPRAHRKLQNWWFRFMRIIRNNNMKNVNLYYLVADLSNCYGNIPHSELLRIVEGLPLVDVLFSKVYRRNLVGNAPDVNSYGKFVELASATGTYSKNLAHIQKESLISGSHGSCVLVSKSSSNGFTKVTRHEILRAVSSLLNLQHIHLPKTNNSRFIHSGIGVPQGCCISNILCSLFLADRDKNIAPLLESISSNGRKLPNLLLRWIDDFLFVSTDQSTVQELYRRLYDGVFGISLNLCKTNSNLDIFSKEGNLECSNSPLEWINSRFEFDIQKGLINVKLLPCKSQECKIRDTLCLASHSGFSFMFSFLEQRIIGYLTNKLCHKIYTSTKINSIDCILENSYTAMLICALKLYCALEVLVFDFGGFINAKYIYKLLCRLVYCTESLVARGGLKTQKYHLDKLLMMAFVHVFSREDTHDGQSRRKFNLVMKKCNMHQVIRKLKYIIHSVPNVKYLYKISSRGKCIV